MAIDGRDLVRPKQTEKDVYSSPAVGVVAALVVIVPIALLVIGSYWIGSLTGGFLGGVLGIASTVATVAVLWALKRRRR